MPRRLQALGKDAPKVETTLDDFISRANAELVDISAFADTEKPPAVAAGSEDAGKAVARDKALDDREQALEAREHALRKQVSELQDRLTAIKAKRRPSQGWGKLVIGFVLGCGVMFGISVIVPRESAAPKQTAATPVAPPAVVQPVAPPAPPKVEVTPIETATPPAQVSQPPQPAAVETAAPPPFETTAAAHPAPKQIKKTKRPAPTETTTPTSKPPETNTGSDNLYNPF